MRVLLALRLSLLCGACSSFDSFYRTSAAKREVMTRKFHFYRSLPNKINCSEDGWSLRVVSLCFLRTTSKSYLTSEVSLLRVLLCCVDVCCKMMTGKLRVQLVDTVLSESYLLTLLPPLSMITPSLRFFFILYEHTCMKVRDRDRETDTACVPVCA